MSFLDSSVVREESLGAHGDYMNACVCILFPLKFLKKSIYSSVQCLFIGGVPPNGLNLAAKRGSNAMTASDWSILGENAI